VTAIQIEGGYRAAWGEISARTRSLQTLHLAHLVAVAVGLAFAAPRGDPALRACADWNPTVALLLPPLSLATALWIRANEAAIGLLSAFCAAIERQADPPNTLGIPAWHRGGQKWPRFSTRHRRVSDHAFALAAALAAWPALTSFACRPLGGASLAYLAVVLMGAGSIVLIWLNRNLRFRLQRGYRFREIDGKWLFKTRE